MANFFSKLFGKNKIDSKIEELLTTAVEGIIAHGDFKLSYEISGSMEGILINFEGEDARLLTEKDAMVLDGFQTYLKRLIQNKMPEQNVDLVVDCAGYLEAAAQELKDLADKLREQAIAKGQAAYVRPLPPRDRKTVHRHLAEDERVKSQSIGEGFCKKIKITPSNMVSRPRTNNVERSASAEGSSEQQNNNNRGYRGGRGSGGQRSRPNNNRNDRGGYQNRREPRQYQNQNQPAATVAAPALDGENFGNTDVGHTSSPNLHPDRNPNSARGQRNRHVTPDDSGV